MKCKYKQHTFKDRHGTSIVNCEKLIDNTIRFNDVQGFSETEVSLEEFCRTMEFDSNELIRIGVKLGREDNDYWDSFWGIAEKFFDLYDDKQNGLKVSDVFDIVKLNKNEWNEHQLDEIYKNINI